MNIKHACVQLSIHHSLDEQLQLISPGETMLASPLAAALFPDEPVHASSSRKNVPSSDFITFIGCESRN